MTLLLLLSLGCSMRPAHQPDVLLPSAVTESSGLVRSGSRPGVLWTHNDSGNGPVLFATQADGTLVQAVEITGATAVDWEDIAVDGEHLWVADMGNNLNMRSDLAVHRIREPAAGVTVASVERTVRFSYPEQASVPDPTQLNFDAEALFVDEGTLYLLTKHRSDQRTVLYRFPRTGDVVELVKLGSFDVGGDPDRYGGMVTAADLSPSGHLAVLTYHAIFVFPRPSEGHWLDATPHRIRLDQDVAGQCEGIAWVGDTLVFSNEDRALFTVTRPLERDAWP